MKSFDTELKKQAEKINLKISERRELRERILSYMEYHPLPKQVFTKEEVMGVYSSESFTAFHFNTRYVRAVAGFFVLVFIVAPFMAEKAVPGDVLYLVKTGINENIQKQLADSPYEKIEFETKLMERRIAEARSLASEGKLTSEVKAEIAETVKEHTVAVQSGIAELKTQDKEGAAIAQIAFSSKLEVQSAVLGAEGESENTDLIEAVLLVVDTAREDVVTEQENNVPSFEALMAQVELETTRAYELFTSVKKSATQEEVQDIERRLSDINRLSEEAKVLHDTEVTIQADIENVSLTEDAVLPTLPSPSSIDNLTSTLGLVQKLIVFMTDIDVRESVALEVLVPIVLSDEERAKKVESDIDDISGIVLLINERLIEVGDIGVKGKIEEGVLEIGALSEEARSNLLDGALSEAEAKIAEARALAVDLDALSQHEGIKIAPEEELIDVEVVPEEVEGSEATTTDVLPVPLPDPEAPETGEFE